MNHLSDMAVFVQVVDDGSFTRAAGSLDVSKAAVSRYVRRLEKHLGARLLNRTTRRLSLTEAGSALYERISRALSEVDAAEAEILELSGAPRGRLRVSAPAYFARGFFVDRIGAFLERYREVQLELDFDNRIIDLVEERFDLAIRITTLASSSLIARRLASVQLVTVASPGYLARHAPPVAPGDLRDHEALIYTPERTPNQWPYRDAQGGPIHVSVSGRLRCNNDDAIMQAALADLGIARFPDIFIREELASGSLVKLLEGFEPEPFTLCAVFPTRENLAPKVRVFVDFLAETVGGQGARGPGDKGARGLGKEPQTRRTGLL